MRSSLMERAAARLAARWRGEIWEVADAWSRRLLPVAAVLAVLLGWGAYRAADRGPPDTPPGAGRAVPVGVEELVRSDTAADIPEILVSSDEPSADRVLTAVVYER